MITRSARALPVPVRAVAATAALAAGGFLVGAPAQASPGGGLPGETAPPAVTESTAGALPPGLAEALQRDLGINEQEFQAAGEAGQRAAAALPQLETTEGFAGLELRNGEILVYGSGPDLELLAQELGARLLAPADGPSDETGPADEITEPAPDSTPPDAQESVEAPAAQENTIPPATDAPKPAQAASDLAALARDYISAVGVQGLQSVALDAHGFTIKVASPEEPRQTDESNLRMASAPTATPADFASSYTNVTVEESAGAGKPLAEEVFGGQGYYGEAGPGMYASCSIGFNGWDPAGNPAVITAGHSTGDGTVAQTLLAPDAGEAPTTALGTFGTSVFGGPGNTPVNPDNPDPATFGTDVAVINSINEDLDLVPEVTQWDSEGLSETTTRITGVGTAVVGQPVCRSGLTTGWKCGTVTELGIFMVAGHNNGPDEEDIRAVIGFISDLAASPGDSGGPVIAGSTALGVVSAGFDTDSDGVIDAVGASDLTSALAYTPGYTVAAFVEAPTLRVQDGDTVYTDQVLTGTAPAGSVVRVSLPGGGSEIPVAADGTWSMKIPRTVGDGDSTRFSLTAAIGFNESRTTEYNLVTRYSALHAPILLSPADGSSPVGAVSFVEGTAEPGATVDIELVPAAGAGAAQVLAAGDPQELTATADPTGAFSAELSEPLVPGNYTLAAVQSGIQGKTASDTATAAFTVLHPAPAITSLRNGEVFTEASAPRTISGTGIAGASLTLGIGSESPATVVSDDGTWSIDVGTWAPGEFTVTAVQELDGVGSAPATATVTVTALQVAAVSRTPGNLAVTGADGGSMMALLSAAGVLLAGGAAGIGLSRRRSTR
ncbi:S1 family peptidase [Arthrobacter sp. BL-252-APC-1A]|uniref:S1 family peptidase n=1 Tax=Arthrobacter sp. BL-252-APC-1A TaxID=2606622 RepID=UPI0018A6CDD0|nr:S1 family peptidase [Arthrobacter sp. BL-252-APC-1A]